jgi:hypothetical protein
MPEQRKNLALKRIFGEKAATNCRTIMLQGVKAFIDEQCELSVNVLIGESSLSSAALEVCNKITKRQTSDKISHWVYSHIKPGNKALTIVLAITQTQLILMVLQKCSQ